MKEALLYQKLADATVQCQLCAHKCIIADGKRGLCQVRENNGGTLFTLVYGRTISQNIDPIEKKPFNHFYPGSNAFSIATPGCNLACSWCQNWEISQMPRDQHFISGRKLDPEEIVAAAVRSGCRSIAYTYTEPTVFFEYCFDTAKLAQKAGIANVFVSNGYMSAEMLTLFSPYLDAANIDLKAFSDATYQRYTGGKLQPVLDSLKKLKELGIWIEVTTLIVPGVNDSSQELQDIATFIATELGPEVPWHVSRFYPNHKLKKTAATPVETIAGAVAIGHAAGLQFVYPGNISGVVETRCPHCQSAVAERSGYCLSNLRISPLGECAICSGVIAGVWGD